MFKTFRGKLFDTVSYIPHISGLEVGGPASVVGALGLTSDGLGLGPPVPDHLPFGPCLSAV